MSQTEVQLIKSNSVEDGDIVGMSSSKLSGTLPAVSGANLTNLPAANLTGTLPAISGANLTNLPASGKFASYAIIADQKATNAVGGTPSTGTFNVRDLNTELVDDDNIVSISSNQFTLQAGTYLIRASAPAYRAGRHQIILWNVTDSSVAQVGTSEYNHNGANTLTRSFVQGRATIGAAKAFEIRHRVEYADPNNGWGVETNYDLQPTIYTVVEIYKES